MALNARSGIAAWFHWLWLVLQILNILFFHVANAAAADLLFGRHLKGELACCDSLQVSICGMVTRQSMLMQDPVTSRKLNHWADDLSCALFGLANVVTAMYYLIDATNGKDALVEGGQIQRPAWLGFSVHVFNSLVAWADILCAHPRSFSKSSGRLSVGIVAFYTIWILICSHFNGAFPYPILNELPWPTVRDLIRLFFILMFLDCVVYVNHGALTNFSMFVYSAIECCVWLSDTLNPCLTALCCCRASLAWPLQALSCFTSFSSVVGRCAKGGC